VSFQLNQTLLIVMTVSIGEVALATRTYVMNLLVFAVVWAISLSMGNQIKVAHLIGAKEFETVHRQLMKTLKLGVLAGFAAMLGLCLISKPLLLIFTKDPRVISLGQTLFYLGLQYHRGHDPESLGRCQVPGHGQRPAHLGRGHSLGLPAGLSLPSGPRGPLDRNDLR
jgi:hypothetical protein